LDATSVSSRSDAIGLEGERHMKGEFLRLLEAAKALIVYVDEEHVFDKAADMGCGGFDTYQSDAFHDLIVATRKAIEEAENALKAS
jgi:hypothetical protein